MYLKAYLLLLFSFNLVISNAQTFSARVLDMETKQSIPYATVETGLNQGLITNEDGEVCGIVPANQILNLKYYIFFYL